MSNRHGLITGATARFDPRKAPIALRVDTRGGAMIRRSMIVSRVVLCAAALAWLRVSAATTDDNWPQFRGPQAGVASDDASLPDTWSSADHVVWKVDVPGLGWSSPVVWGDHVFLTTVINSG